MRIHHVKIKNFRLLAKQAAFERNRNLFYVAYSRPKRRLALLFTQKLSPMARGTLGQWFGADVIESLPL